MTAIEFNLKDEKFKNNLLLYLSLGAYKKVCGIREYSSDQMIHQGYYFFELNANWVVFQSKRLGKIYNLVKWIGKFL